MTFTSSSRLPGPIRAIATARAISLLGDEIALLALLFRAKGELGHWGVAAMLIAGTAPLVLFGPFAGLLVDRVRVRPLLIATLTAQAITCVALAFSSGIALLALIGLLATATSVVTPAFQVLIPTLVSDEELPRAMGLAQSLFAIAGVAGPFLGGILFATFGFNWVMLLNAATFVVIAGVVLVLRVDRAPERASGEKDINDNWRSGLRIIGREPLLRSLAILLVMVVLTFGVVNVVEIFYTTVVLHAGPRAYGVLGLCMGAGMLVASSLTGKLTSRFLHAERVFLFACASLIALLFAFSQVRSVWQAAIVLFIVGLANAVLNIQANLLLVRSTMEVAQFRGRIFSAVSSLMSASQIISIAIGGALLAIWGPRTIIMSGSIAAAFALALTFRPVLEAGASELIAVEATSF